MWECEYKDWDDNEVAIAIKEGNVDLLKEMVFNVDEILLCWDEGYDCNYENPLEIAADYNQLEVVKFLVERGADLSKSKKTPALAAKNNNIEMIKYLESKGLDPFNKEVLDSASSYKSLEAVRYVLQKKGIDAKDALISACYENYTEIAKMLLEYGADVSDGEALAKACWNGNFQLVKLIVEHGCDVNAYGRLPLKFAIDRGHKDVVKFLVEKGAKLPEPESRMAVDSTSSICCCTDSTSLESWDAKILTE